MKNAVFLRETVDLVKEIETRFLELAARLYTIQTEKLWEGQHDSFMDFTDDAGLQRPFVSKLLAIHNIYVLEHRVALTQLSKVGYQKLYEALPLLQTDDAKTVINKAYTLTLVELREEVREDRHGEHKHVVGTERWGTCKKCGKFVKLQNEEKN